MSPGTAAGGESFDVAYLVLSGTTAAARCPELLRGLVGLGFSTVIAIPTPNASRVIAPRDLAGVKGVQVVESYFDLAIRPRPPRGVASPTPGRLPTRRPEASPGDLASVFDAMLEKALHLCEAASGIMWSFDGERARVRASREVPAEFIDYLKRQPPGAGPDTFFGRAILTRSFVTSVDISAEEPYRKGVGLSVAAVELGGIRAVLMAPLVKDNTVPGVFSIFRKEVRPFTDKQIALLQNFAAQAVIAMENARLITETREALEQQTATAEVLQVINSSPGDLAPVFDAMLEKAMRLCEATFGILRTYDGDRYHTAAAHGVPPAYAEFMAHNPERAQPGTIGARVLHGEPLVHVVDVKADEVYRAGALHRRALVDLGGARTSLVVPLTKDRVILGVIQIYRQHVQPFSDKQIALLQNFAAQAVIAMENARLITEQREALEQQTATAEVLQVINGSPGDLGPVFDAMLEKAMRLCTAAFGYLMTLDGERFVPVAQRGLPSPFAEYLSRLDQRGSSGAYARIRGGAPLVHIEDLMGGEVYRTSPLRRALVDLGGARTGLIVALRRDEVLLGVFTIYRQEVRGFSDKEIALVQNFAAQAVIAMENARLLDEIRQRQTQLRVTFDNMVDGVAMFDEALQLAAWNRNFQELLQLPDEFLAEPHGFDDYIRYLTERGEFGETDPDTQITRLRERLGDHYSFERTRPDGKVIEVRNNPMPDGGIVVIYSDITERKRAEEEIRTARDTAEATLRDLRAAQSSLIQAQKMAALGQLTAGIAHEIKNPLNFVNNFADLSVELLDELKETTAPAVAALDDDKRAEVDETMVMLSSNLDKIAEHGRRADGIVKSMLEHSRGVTSERRKADLNNLVEEALNLAYHGARAQDQSFNITLDREYDRDLDQIELVPQEMSRVFINMIGNGFYAAVKRQRENAGPDFRPTLTVATQDLGEVVEVRIRDNGIGIPDEIKDKLFQPFFTTKPTGEGTGLGLSISYDIVTQQHGGTIEVESRVGEFTEFTVRLPRAYRATTAEAAS
jgi:PAS domain S-box-containing protein